MEANTVRLEEHGKTVLVLEKSATSVEPGGAGNNSSKLVNTHTHTALDGTRRDLGNSDISRATVHRPHSVQVHGHVRDT